MANTKSTIKEIKTSLEGIGHILSDRQIAVPPYQRSYAWGETQVNDMLLDLSDAMKDGLEEYFLGSIVGGYFQNWPSLNSLRVNR